MKLLTLLIFLTPVFALSQTPTINEFKFYKWSIADVVYADSSGKRFENAAIFNVKDGLLLQALNLIYADESYRPRAWKQFEASLKRNNYPINKRPKK
jgi:hypothetical protein